MSESKHTPEPWALSNIGLPSDIPMKGYVYPLGTDGDKAVANAARIVACVNACAGMDDPEAELAALREVAKAAQKVAQRSVYSRKELWRAAESASALRAALAKLESS